jgi:uncharacterized protein
MKANEFLNRFVRDLSWILCSPPLMKSSVFNNQSEEAAIWNPPPPSELNPWLEWLDAHPEELEAFIKPGDFTPAGKIFELYLQFFFTEHPAYDLLDANIQLSEEGTTIGELDLIVRDHSSEETVHIEAACKFYLSSNYSKSWNSWIGPNSSDSLDKKIHKLSEQLGNIGLASAAKHLRSSSIQINRSVAFMKGYFFHHFKHVHLPKNPKNGTPNYCSGVWIYQSEIPSFDPHQLVWHVLSRDRWFAPMISQTSGSSLKDLEQFIDNSLKKLNRPVLLARMLDGHSEDLRMFIVADNWPY